MKSNDDAGIAFAQPRSKKEREGVAGKCCSTLEMSMPLLVDEIDDRVGHAYSGMPDRLYVIGKDGRVVYKGGRGPFGFNAREMEQSLALYLLDLETAAKKTSRVPVLPDEKGWKALPKPSRGAGLPLPAWARALAHALPRTTAAMLELDYLHRARSPLGARLAGLVRREAACANGCRYGQAYAEADLERAGVTKASLRALDADPSALPERERLALGFARKLSRAANTITDSEVKRLRKLYGDAGLVALVQLLAYANFQDRLVLALGVDVEPGGPLPPPDVRFPPGSGGASAPARKPISSTASAPAKVDDPDWARLGFDDLKKQMEAQRGREARIRVPAWDDVKKVVPPGTPLPAKPVRIRWSLVCMGYQPRLAGAWGKCTRAFAGEAKQDRVFEESLFWVVTRALECFY
jgi:alkylhydroperoxidase family enzyme